MNTGEQNSAVVSAEAYDVSGVLPIEELSTIPAGTSLLVAGPAMTGKQRIAMELLARGTRLGEYAIAVSPDTDAERLIERFGSLDGGDPDRLHVVDCTGPGHSSMDDTERVKYVSSPDDLTGIGIGIAKCTNEIGAGGSNGLRLALLSLSTVLQYASIDRVFNFLHVLTRRVSAANYLGICTFDPSAHDPQTANTIRSQFDAVAEVRETDEGTREVRVLGLPDVPRTWVEL